MWRQIEIAGKSADVFEPQSLAVPGRAVLFLHGHGLLTLRDNPAYTEELNRRGLRCLCPFGQRSWWGDRICHEFDPTLSPVKYLLECVVPWIATEWETQPPAIALLGVSMGGQGALRLAYRHANKFPIVAVLAPAVDFQIWHGRGLPLDEMYDTREAARQETATLQLHPLNWPRHQFLLCDPDDADWFDGCERLASKLVSTGIPFDSDLETRHGGHSWEYFNYQAPRVMDWIGDRLQREQ